MNIISIINVKGGVGKTITTLNLASAIAQKNKRVLLIDNDPQSSLTQIGCVIRKVNCLYDVYKQNTIGFNEVIITKSSPGIDIIPNTIESASLENDLRKFNREAIFKNKLDTIPKIYDYVLIDNSPFLGLCVANSLGISDYYLEVIDNSSSAIKGLKMVQDTISEIVETNLNKNIKKLGILRNRFDKRTNYTKQVNGYLQEEMSKQLFDTIIYDSVKYREATLMNKLIHDYDINYGIPYDNLFQEIETRINNNWVY